MTPRQYLRLADRETKLIAGLGILIGFIYAVNALVLPSPSAHEVLSLQFMPLLTWGVVLARIAHGVNERSAFIVVPGLGKALWRWNTGIMLGLSLFWGALTHQAVPQVPWLVSSVVSAFVLSLLLIAPSLRRIPRGALFSGAITGVILWTAFLESLWHRLTSLAVQHATSIGVLCAALTVVQLRIAASRQRGRQPETPLVEPGRGATFALPDRLAGFLGRPLQDYPAKRSTLREWIAAVQQEQPGYSYRKGMVLAGAVLLLLLPLVKESGGYPRAWYLMVFRWNEGIGPIAAFLIWMGLIAAGLFVPLPRRDVLYPIPRRRRAQVAFWSSAGTWSVLLATWVGGPLVLGSLVGWWLEQPLGVTGAIRFAAPAVVALPALATLQWAALCFEGKSDLAMGAICCATLFLTFVGWITLSVCPPGAAVALATLIGAGSMAMYYAGLQAFYLEGDLIQPLPAKPVFRMR